MVPYRPYFRCIRVPYVVEASETKEIKILRRLRESIHTVLRNLPSRREKTSCRIEIFPSSLSPPVSSSPLLFSPTRTTRRYHSIGHQRILDSTARFAFTIHLHPQLLSLASSPISLFFFASPVTLPVSTPPSCAGANVRALSNHTFTCTSQSTGRRPGSRSPC